MGRHGGPRIDTAILREVEHSDLIHYGLIPEFVGRLPIISVLQVRRGAAALSSPAIYCRPSCWCRRPRRGLTAPLTP
jgi:hypothetical protein